MAVRMTFAVSPSRPLEMTTLEMSVGLHVADDGFNGRAAAQLALGHAEDASPLARDEDGARMRRFVSAIALVDIGCSISQPHAMFSDSRRKRSRRLTANMD
jgi:hypothetical protein